MLRVENAKGTSYLADLYELVEVHAGPKATAQVESLCLLVQRILEGMSTSEQSRILAPVLGGKLRVSEPIEEDDE